MCHLDHHRNLPTKIIVCAIWILILLEAAKTPNGYNQNPIINYGETRMLTGGPVGRQESTKVEELDIDFRVPGLSHGS